MLVVYFDKRTGAPHAVGWSKSFFDAKSCFNAENFFINQYKGSE